MKGAVGNFAVLDKKPHYNWHRYYDPQLGRYLRADPLKISERITQARSYASSFSMLDISGFESLVVYYSLIRSGILFNSQLQDLFSYAKNNPINFSDPDGQYAQVVIVGGGVIIGGAIILHHMQNNGNGSGNWTETVGQPEKPPGYQPGIHEKCVLKCAAYCNFARRIACYIICVLGGGIDAANSNP